MYFLVQMLLVLTSVVCATQAQTVCTATKMDLVFVVDSSGSIRDGNPSDGSYDNYGLLKTFMKNIVDRVYEGPEYTRIGAVIFSNGARNVFFLNSYSNKAAINDAIDKMEYIGGETNTSGGIRLMRSEQFSSNHGSRADARKVAIVIADGQSNRDANKTIEAAVAARNDFIDMLAVGITTNINVEEIKQISSQPQELNKNYFISTNFNVLNDIVDKLGLRSCVTTTTTVAPTSCNSVVDLMFVVDSSGSIKDNNPSDGSYDNYELIQKFMIDTLDQMNIGPANTRVGLIIFADNAEMVFKLNTYSTKSQIVAAIRAMDYKGGNTNTGSGLRLMLQQGFNYTNGDRADVDNVAIVITDGQSTVESFRTIDDARRAQQSVTIFSVGITDKIKPSELRDISSPPHLLNQTYFTSIDFNSLGGLVNQLETQICSSGREATRQGSCIRPTSDVVFVIDSSGSICSDQQVLHTVNHCDNYKQLKDFVNDLVKAMKVYDTRIGLVLYGNVAYNVFYLNTHNNESDVINHVNTMEYLGGNTNTSGALKVMLEEQFTLQRGDRNNAENIAIVITDGVSVNKESTLRESHRAQQAGITVYTVGITKDVNVQELKWMSSPPQQPYHNYYLAADFSSLNQMVQLIVNGYCPDDIVTMTPIDDNENTLLYGLLLVAVFVFLVILRSLIYCCQRSAENTDDKQLLI